MYFSTTKCNIAHRESRQSADIFPLIKVKRQLDVSSFSPSLAGFRLDRCALDKGVGGGKVFGKSADSECPSMHGNEPT